jgi:hypothetical protein
MTVQELIDELQKIEDKSLPVKKQWFMMATEDYDHDCDYNYVEDVYDVRVKEIEEYNRIQGKTKTYDAAVIRVK